MVGHKLGEFAPTRTFRYHAGRNGRRGADMPGVKTNEVEARVRSCGTNRMSASKARQVSYLVRGKDVRPRR